MAALSWAKSQDCFLPTLRSLARPACLERLTLQNGGAWNVLPSAPAVYVLSAPELAERRARVVAQLGELEVVDVTLVGCANRDDLVAMDAARQRCLCPELLVTRWVTNVKYLEYKRQRRQFNMPFINISGFYTPNHPYGISFGVFSLAVKHKIAYFDL